MEHSFKGAAKRLDDIDLPKLGHRLGVGEDEIHAFLDVETRGHGFDSLGRPIILFEPHVFYRNLTGAKRTAAVKAGLAYKNWGAQPYPKDSYPRLKQACAIDETAALKAASWGLGQVLGENHKAAGFATVQDMVSAMMADEEEQLGASVNFILANKLDDELRAHNWAGFARGYNGAGYAKNRYDVKLAEAYRKWSRIKDTPWAPGKPASTLHIVRATVEPPRPEPPPAPPQDGVKPDVILVDGPTKDETTVVVVPTPQNAPASPVSVGAPSKSGYVAIGAFIAAAVAFLTKYFGG